MFLKFSVLAILAACSFAFRASPDFMTTDDLERYFSVSSFADVPEYEIVDPIAYSAGGRYKRHIEMKEATKEIKLRAFDEDIHMKLEENTQLIAEGLTVDVHNEDGVVEKLPLTTKNCFYHGEVVSHKGSKVSVTTCDGVMGMIGTESHDLFIRPLIKEHKEKYQRQRRHIENPHLIYRRTRSTTNPNAFCALDPEYPEASAMLHATMAEMDDMQAGLAPPPQEVIVDIDDTNSTISADSGEDVTTKATVTVEDRGNATDGSSRKKRQADIKYLEVRVLADVDMVNYYTTAEVIPYTLMLMNIVAARYVDSSLGRTIIIHIVKLGYLTSDFVNERLPNGRSVDLNVQIDGVATLNSWSWFQYQTNPFSDDNVDHWDNAILITRKNIQYNGASSLLGIAWGNSTCYGPRQANVNQDQGLSSGIVIAHEIGHTLGMDHDNDNGCQNGINVMSSHRPNGAGSFSWSSCSRNDLNLFLSDPYKQCLNDLPAVSEYPLEADNLPGRHYTADEQCRLQSTDRQKYVGSCTSNLNTICANLACLSDRGYCSSSVAAAEGTECGPGMWCISGRCERTVNQWVVNEGQCSVTCGQGTRSNNVYCQSPLGETLPDSSCDLSTKPSVVSTCLETECPPFWQPFPWGQCSTTCGTGVQTRDVWCVVSSGQNLVRKSDEDCNTQPDKPATTQPCSNPIQCGVWVTTPFSECSVTCGEGTRTRTVACKESSTSAQYLDDSQCQGTRPHIVEVCSMQDCSADISYSWYQTSTYGKCSVTCGTGIRSTQALCFNEQTFTQVNDNFCDSGTKPQSATEICTEAPCPQTVSWKTESNSPCSESCGDGIKTMRVFCVSTATNIEISDSECNADTRPDSIIPCNLGDCPTSNQGVYCAGLWTQPVFNLARFTSSTGGQLCKESIVAQPGQRITLTFSHCFIRRGEGDQGFVRDGFRVLSLSCDGYLDENGEPFSWTSETHVIQIEHLSFEPQHGYAIDVEFVGKPANGCDKVLTTPSGEVTSPNYSSDDESFYPNINQVCQTVIIAPPGMRVEMTYQHIDLFDIWYSRCSDRLEVYDLDTGDEKRYCGRPSNPSALEQPDHDNRVLVQFRSNADGYVSYGFLISYEFVPISP